MLKTIKLDNQTHYNSKDLRKLFAFVLKEYKRTRFNFKYETVRVKCIYRRVKDGFCGGYAYYNDNFVCIKLPKLKTGYYKDETFEQNISRTFMHECDHCRGMKHGEMPDEKSRDVSFIPADMIVREKIEKIKPKATDTDKIQALENRKKTWSSKLTRCKNAIKKIEVKIKYYERKGEKNKTIVTS